MPELLVTELVAGPAALDFREVDPNSALTLRYND